MTEQQILARFPNASKSFIKANLALHKTQPEAPHAPDPAEQHVKHGGAKRIRQSSKPNKLEQAWREHLQTSWPHCTIREQAMKLKLANGAFYKPDVVLSIGGRFTCYECKGPSKMKGVAKGMLAVKVAAAQWPEIVFVLVWKGDDGLWKTQTVLP